MEKSPDLSSARLCCFTTAELLRLTTSPFIPIIKDRESPQSCWSGQGIVGVHLITAAEGVLPSFYEKFGFKREQRVMLMGMETE